MFHYTRPSFNTSLPPDAMDGLMAGSQRHTLNPNDLTAIPKIKQPRVPKPKGKVDPLLTTRSKPIAIQRKKGKKKKK